MKNEKMTYAMCRICGFEPSGKMTDPMNILSKWWDPDDGWKIGALCIGCYQDTRKDKPKPEDYAYDRLYGFPDCETDEDPILAL